MKLRWIWIMCIVVSLAVHVVWLNHFSFAVKSKPNVATPSIVISKAEPVIPPTARLAPQPAPTVEAPKPEPIPKPPPPPAQTATPLPQQPERFRPNIEEKPPEKNKPRELAEETPKAEDNKLEESKLEKTAVLDKDELEKVKPSKKDLAKAAPPEKPNFKKEIGSYREKLLAKFKDEWQKVPELNTVIADLTMLPKIDKHFGMKILAYSFVENKPAAPFIIFDTETDACQKVDEFDFSSYSNRIKDRMLYPQYREKLEKARREYGINFLMKVIGLVPMETDRYFCAKQMRSVQLAKVSLEQVIATIGHYESDGSGGFNLIIDKVLTKDGHDIPVKDEELKFSVVARN